jgi:AcrR family transcriptional regulator
MARLPRPPSRKSVGNTRSGEAREAIAEAAANLLMEEGLDGFTIEGVARAARSGKPTIYKWWGDKTKLAYDVYAQTVPVVTPDTGDGQSARAKICAFHEELWKIWDQPKLAEISRHLIADAQSDLNSIAAYRDEYFSKRLAPLFKLVRDGIDNGDLPETIDVDTVVDLLTGFHMLRLLLDRPVDRATIQRALDIVLSGAAGVAKDN